ncbi:MAG: hypothetical protein ACR2O8_11635 [Rhizobiaceae bacterium]
MKKFTAALLASVFISSPALACSYGKTAEVEKPLQTAMVVEDSSSHSMSTYDPAKKPVFEGTNRVSGSQDADILEETDE